MNNARSKAEHSKAKNLRQGVTETRDRSLTSHPRKQARPWKVMTMWDGYKRLFGTAEFCVHRCPSKEMAEAWIAKAVRGRGAQGDYWIEGPESTR